MIVRWSPAHVKVVCVGWLPAALRAPAGWPPVSARVEQTSFWPVIGPAEQSSSPQVIELFMSLTSALTCLPWITGGTTNLTSVRCHKDLVGAALIVGFKTQCYRPSFSACLKSMIPTPSLHCLRTSMTC